MGVKILKKNQKMDKKKKKEGGTEKGGGGGIHPFHLSWPLLQATTVRLHEEFYGANEHQNHDFLSLQKERKFGLRNRAVREIKCKSVVFN